MRFLPTASALAFLNPLHANTQAKWVNQLEGDTLLCRSVETDAEANSTLVRHGLASLNDRNFLVGNRG